MTVNAREEATNINASMAIDAYLAPLPADKRAALEHLRRTIAAAVPEAVEAISYGVPAFKYRGRPVAGFAAAKEHCSLFPMSGTVMDQFQAELEGYGRSKGAIRFSPDKPLPDELVTNIVRARVAEVDAALAKKGGREQG